MNRLERLHAITNHLRSRSPRTVPASALAEWFGVSQRTIERDLRSINEADVPIFGFEGRTGGCTILPEHSIPALQLTEQQAAACIAALSLVDASLLSINPKRARLCRPQSNGKVERFRRAIADGWAYARCHISKQERRDALPEWPHPCNWQCPHSACGNQ